MLCGNQPNHLALAHKVAAKHDLIAVILEEKKTASITIFNIIPKLIDKLFFNEINEAWSNLMKHYQTTFKGYPQSEIIKTSDINDNRINEILKQLNPELVIVSGTSLIRKSLIELKFPKGIINLHTGISPYVKGGPNCTNWCLANNEFHLIGNTIMWLNAGIDSGNLIATETTDFTGNENLYEIHFKVMEHAHRLYLKVISQIQEDSTKCPSVRQKDISKGNLFLSKMWNFSKKKDLLKNISDKKFQQTIQSTEYREKKNNLKLVNF